MYANAKFELEQGFWQQPWYKIAGAFLILGGLCYLGISAILGAFYGMLVGIDLATYWVFGLNWWEALVELLLLFGLTTVPLLLLRDVFADMALGAKWIGPVSYARIRRVTSVVIVWIIATHLLMSIFLAPMKREMAAIDAANPNPSLVATTEGSLYKAEYDFGGKLTALVAKRDARLKRYGYVRLGKGWDVNPMRGGKASVYVFIPGAAILWDWWFGYDQAIE